MSFISSTNLEVKQLLAQFEATSISDQLMMTVLAVIYKPIYQKLLNVILADLVQSGVFNIDELMMAAKARHRLVKLGLIEDGSKGVQLNRHLLHTLSAQCVANGTFEDIVASANQIVPVKTHYTWGYQEPINKQCEFRQHLYIGDFGYCQQLLNLPKNPQLVDSAETDFLVEMCFYPFDQAFFCRFSEVLQYQLLAMVLLKLRDQLMDTREIVTLIEGLHDKGLASANVQLLLVEQYLLLNDLDKAGELLSKVPESGYGLALSGWLLMLQDDAVGAIVHFERCIVAKNKVARRVRQYIGEMPGVFYLLALLQLGFRGKDKFFGKLSAELFNYQSDQRTGGDFTNCYENINVMGRVLGGKTKKIRIINFKLYQSDDNFYFRLEVLLSALCFGWSQQKLPQDYLDRLTKYAGEALSNGSLWYAKLAAELLDTQHWQDAECQALIKAVYAQTNIDSPLRGLVEKKEAWLQALDQLIALKTPSQGAVQPTPVINQSRLAWFVMPRPPYQVMAKEQKMGKRGWSKGRAVALKRLRETPEEFDFLTPSDHQLCSAIDKSYLYGYYGDKLQYSLEGITALKACMGHPDIYIMEKSEQPIEIILGQPELMITESANGYNLYMPDLPDDADDFDEDEMGCFGFTATGPNRYVLTEFTGEHLSIAEIVGSGGINIPREAKAKVLESISAIAPLLNIQSDIAGIEQVDTAIEQVEPDQTLYINIQPSGQGLQMECHVQPFGEFGPMLPPGTGNSMVVTQIENKRVMTNRLLDVERKHLDLLVAHCPLFGYMVDHLLVLDDLEDALNSLEQLEALHHSEEQPSLVLLWPLGKELKLTKTVSQQQMSVTVGKQKDWFSIEGELSIGDDEVMDLKNLLTLMEASPGRFVRLEDNRFIALTDQLRQQLRDIAATAFNGQFHALAVPLIDEATNGMQVKSNQAWQQQLQKLKQSFAITPQLPTTLEADLRDYQHDGFDWAYRLSHWGAGACLADDMGLGKTIQALAVILARAAQGPTLVLAPTSVCFNWQDEAHRFAPTLKVKMFGMSSKTERQQMLDDAQPFELIVCSYGLLQTQGESLTNVKWHTIVADEAQAIKNPQAKRSQVAMTLEGDFKMITTGTPIENNLTELWSLFRFINPGLLGSKQQFQQRFVNTIENADKDEGLRKEASQALRRMISPFILRRLKRDVLTELPSRTEINLHVELSKEETTFYEALRQQAVEKLLKSDDKPGQKRIKILAEIMRLRRACCHPELVAPDCGIEGSKLKVFDDLVDELMQGGHKALVFSQFVGHLDILRKHLIEKGVSFQYLDGSTTPAKRKQAVNAFQRGEGDLFLISLKAGGAGLNLTAADYVIHMDPWWNPAVEDQASDRAHRMGQTRPVTIYRLITQHTIEDKIVALHQQKRDLANSLLEGTDSAGNLSLNDMMNLLNETG